MHFVTYNIQYSLGKDDRFDIERIAKEVDGADVIALQEVECFWEHSGNIHQPEALAACLPRYHWVYGPHLDLNADTVAADGSVTKRRRQFGTMLLSRTPILSCRTIPLPKRATITQFSPQLGALEGLIDTPAGALRVYSLHLHHIVPELRLQQLEFLLALHRRAPSEGAALCGEHPRPEMGWFNEPLPPMPREAVLLGDFNFTPDSAEYTALLGPTHPRHGRLLSADGFTDAWVAAGHEEASGATFPGVATRYQDETPPRRIDYCFLSSVLAPRVRRAWVDTEAQGSDHQPLHVEIDLEA